MVSSLGWHAPKPPSQRYLNIQTQISKPKHTLPMCHSTHPANSNRYIVIHVSIQMRCMDLGNQWLLTFPQECSKVASTKNKQVSLKPRKSLTQLKEMQVSLCATNHAQTKNTYYIQTQILKQLFSNIPSDAPCCSNQCIERWITIIQGLSWHWLKWIVEVEIELYVGDPDAVGIHLHLVHLPMKTCGRALEMERLSRAGR